MKYLSSFQNIHNYSSIIVCGCGESLNDLNNPERFITSGVNDVGRRFQPNYLVVVNPKNQFSGDRFKYVETSQAEYLFTQLDLPVKHPNIVKFKLGQFGGTDFSDPNVLHYTNNSPYIALNLAILMGAKRIGLIGVDFTDHHFFARSGKHPLAPQFEAINEQYRKLAEAAKANGVEIFNLSAISRLTAFPKISTEEFENLSNPKTIEKSESLKIVSYSTTPVAGVPAILARCINAKTEHTARCVWATNDYGNGVKFTGDVEWNKNPREAERLLAKADLVIVHNGKTAPQHTKYFKEKAVITMAHNYLWNVDEQFFKKGFPGAVVGQYQAVLPEFKNWFVVPNPMPFWEAEYEAKEKNELITICYTPSGKHEKYPDGHKLYWHSKGYETTVRILEKLAKNFPIKLEIIGNKQISHAESLAMKRRSHIVIDECVTGSYHRNSLEGLACGAVVINGIGILPEVEKVLQFCTGESAENPFVSATLENLEEVLVNLIENGKENLIEKGKANRLWIEENWDFSNQWRTFWMKTVEKSLRQTGREFPTVKCQSRDLAFHGQVPTAISTGEKEMKQYKNGVSVVVPHGGWERLPHLQTCLANLRQCADVSEIIVVEMGKEAFAEKTARRWADKYVFIYHEGAFERAAALNTGGEFAESEFVFWLDNDLLMANDFFSNAVAEMRRNNLDYLKPYLETFYLSAADSEKVMQGILPPEKCKPANIFRANSSGRAEIVRKDFLLAKGGIPEGFRGWGGEDNAWSHKAALLGRTGTTQNRNQKLFHLFHLLSGGYGGDMHRVANPHYDANVKLLYEMVAVRNPSAFLEKYPPQKYCPWDISSKIVFVADENSSSAASEIAAHFAELFGVSAETKIVSVDAAKTPANFLEKPTDAFVFFDIKLAEKFLSQTDFADEYQHRTVVLAIEKFDRNSEINSGKLIPVVLNEQFAESESLQFWHFQNNENGLDLRYLALTLAQPLSLILSKAKAEKQCEPETIAEEKAALPVWFYWEGSRPAWIEACHQTIIANAPTARFLTPETFDELWTEDRDIDIARLYVAHRADFIRAYLLAHFGGFWLDADCILMKDAGELLGSAGEYDFVAHRERNGLFTNDLMGAKLDSKIAREFYEQICRTLRKSQNISWRAIGGEPLTDILHKTDQQFLELECRIVQPICWSEPEKFFAAGSESEHLHNFDDKPVCYMLSNGAVINYQKKFPNADLTAENSFFNFLVRRALNKNQMIEKSAPENKKNVSGENGKAKKSTLFTSGRRRKILDFYIGMIDRIKPQAVLDVDDGSGRWGFLLRDLFEASDKKKDWQISIDGVLENKRLLNGQAHLYDRIKIEKVKKYFDSVDEKKDLVILDDFLVRENDLQGGQVLERSLEFADYVLLNLDQKQRSQNIFFETHADLIVAQNRLSEDGYVSLLLSAADPKNLGTRNVRRGTFTQAAEFFSNQKQESVSGPGSSLVQTSEIRRRLPVLFASLDIDSMLDAPCGDLNWMRHVDLRLEKYVGIDIVPSIIEQNRRQFENRNRKFYVSDMTNDFLPRCALVFCRDCLVHFSFEEIWATLRNFYNSGAEYLLTTTFPNRQSNYDIQTGDWRPLNFQLAPFNFPAPLRLINEHCTEGNGQFADKSLGLWKLKDILR